MYKISIINDKNPSLINEVVGVEFNQLHTITETRNYSPFTFNDGKRNQVNSKTHNLICFDIDDTLELEKAIDLCSNFKSLIVTTKSHQLDKKGLICDRFRIIIPIDKEVPKEQFKSFYIDLSKYLTLDSVIDKACNDSSRYFYPNANQEVFYSSSSNIISYDEVMPKLNEVTKVNNYQDTSLLNNELPHNFIFKDGSSFGSYEYLAINETVKIRCFNAHHEDKNPSAFISRNPNSGKLFTSCSSCNETKFIKYPKEDGIINNTHNPLNSNHIIAKSINVEPENVGLDLFNKFKMTKTRREELKNMKYVIDGLIVENYHTYLMGNAGAGKTTILLHLCFEMVQKGYKVYYFYLDGALNTASKVDEEIERLEIEDNFNLLVDGTMNDYKDILEKFIATKSNLDKTVFILDTFKFLSADVNHKNANKEAMHLIKEVCKLGATFISLGHTNKDGAKFSGTAEIEQDSDGVLRIDGIDEANNQTVSTIKKGGRCRFDVKETSFTFRKGNILSVEKLDEVVDTENQLKQKETEKNDKFVIDEIKRVLRVNPNILQKDIIPKVMENTAVSKNKILKILNSYVEIHWKRTQSKEATNGYEYKVIDTEFTELIGNLTNKLSNKAS